MNDIEKDKQILESQPITWNCRHHPTDWWHEVGCPHQSWTVEQLQSALEKAKQSLSLSILHIRQGMDGIEKELRAEHGWFNDDAFKIFIDADPEAIMEYQNKTVQGLWQALIRTRQELKEKHYVEWIEQQIIIDEKIQEIKTLRAKTIEEACEALAGLVTTECSTDYVKALQDGGEILRNLKVSL